MATTKIWSIKHDLNKSISYIMNKEKTMNGKLVTGLHCIPRMAYDQMNMTKQRFGKTGGNLGFHAYQSFPAGEVTPQQAHEIGVEFARRTWGAASTKSSSPPTSIPTAITTTSSSTPCPSGTASTTTTPAAPTMNCVKLPT